MFVCPVSDHQSYFCLGRELVFISLLVKTILCSPVGMPFRSIDQEQKARGHHADIYVHTRTSLASSSGAATHRHFVTRRPNARSPDPPPVLDPSACLSFFLRCKRKHQPKPKFTRSIQYQTSVSSSASEVLAATPADLSLKVEEGADGRPVVLSMPYVTGKLEEQGVVQPGMVRGRGGGAK